MYWNILKYEIYLNYNWITVKYIDVYWIYDSSWFSWSRSKIQPFAGQDCSRCSCVSPCNAVNGDTLARDPWLRTAGHWKMKDFFWYFHRALIYNWWLSRTFDLSILIIRSVINLNDKTRRSPHPDRNYLTWVPNSIIQTIQTYPNSIYRYI